MSAQSTPSLRLELRMEQSNPANLVWLDVPEERMEFCHHCQDERRFIVDRELATARIGKCISCKRDKRFPFSRTVSEV
jgi:hypothetical protein